MRSTPQAEHNDLTTRGRIEIARKIESARELGDLSENGDYHAAKEEQGKMEGRIRHLTRSSRTPAIVEDVDADSSSPAAWSACATKATTTSSATSSAPSRSGASDLDVISPGSPLGEALIGHQDRRQRQLQPPGGVLTVKVVSIET